MSAQLRRSIEYYLREAPLFAGIVRSVECALIAEAGPLLPPVLDLGCGDGVFAKAAFQDAPCCGIDPSFSAIAEAQNRAAARSFCVGDATSLPFPDASYRTIVSNSVLEHIPDLEGAIRESARVLMPEGRLIVTSPSEQFGRMLLGTRALSGMGLRGPAAAYSRWFNGHSLHYHTDSLEIWRERLSRNGFQVTTGFYYLTSRAHSLFDLLHYASGWRWVRHRLTGRWAPDRDSWGNRFWTRRILSVTQGSWPVDSGPYLYIDATKK